ncbi:hypothetical protein DCC62_28755 [candidate division KSB1 bacterium]|nr:MAG: hypothetical protein DCC62_28755 [candidate division KSB1 bacterium]
MNKQKTIIFIPQRPFNLVFFQLAGLAQSTREISRENHVRFCVCSICHAYWQKSNQNFGSCIKQFGRLKIRQI